MEDKPFIDDVPIKVMIFHGYVEVSDAFLELTS